MVKPSVFETLSEDDADHLEAATSSMLKACPEPKLDYLNTQSCIITELLPVDSSNDDEVKLASQAQLERPLVVYRRAGDKYAVIFKRD